MLVNGLPFLSLVRTERICYFGGRTGSGKTALAFRTAYDLVRTGFSRYLLTNVPCVWADSPSDVVVRDGQYLDVCIVLDEAGQFLRMGRDAEAFISAMRKLNVVLLLPSHRPVPRSCDQLRVRMVFDFTLVGLPVWLYAVRYRLERGADKYYLWWVRPSEIFGVYDTQYFATGDAGLSEWMAGQKARLANAGGSYVGVRGYRREGGDVVVEDEGPIWDAGAERLADAVQALEEVADRLAEQPRGRRKRGR
jgi:hypothetical protein